MGIFLVFCFLKCTNKNLSTTPKKYHAKNTQIIQKNGVTYFQDKPFSGILYALDTKDDTIMLTPYSNGKADGIWKFFYEKNKLREIRQFTKGKKTGKMQVFWENGQKKTECYFENDEYQGVFKNWSSSGMLIAEMHYNKGHEEGTQKVWYDNGKIKANYIIKNGRRFGLLGTKNCENTKIGIK